MVGRPRQFDRDEVLDKAITLFWEQGFEATGIAQLSDRLGIGRQSIYGTFGDKRGLFLEAIKRYSSENITWIRTTLQQPGRTIENIHVVLDTWAIRASDCDYCGCFLTNSMSELGVRDPEMGELLARNLGRMTDAFEGALVRCQSEGDLSDETDAHALAKALVNTAQGLSSAGKVDHDYAQDVIAQVKRLIR